MKYIVFDCPDPGMRSTATYEERYNVLKREIPNGIPLKCIC